MKAKSYFYKRIFVKLLSVVIAISFIVPEISVLASKDSYDAIKLDMPSIAASDPSFSMKYEDFSINPNIKSMTLSYAWTGSVAKNNTTQYMYVATENSNSTEKVYPFKKDNAVMFYAKLPADAQKQEMFFQMVASNRGDVKKYGKEQWIQIGNNKKVYYLLNGDTEWQEKTAPVSSVGGNLGNLEFSAGFEGWVRIPYDSFNIDESLSTDVFRFEFRPKQLGGDYTPSDLKSGSISFGSFFIVENGKEDYTKVSIDGGDAVGIATELYCHRTNTLIPSSVNGLENYKNLTVINNGYTHYASSNKFSYSFDNKAITAQKDGSVFIYANIPIDKSDNLKIDINGNAVMNGKKCLIINRGDSEWKETTVTNGKISLPKGFEGYIQIPVTAVTDLKENAVNKIAFEAENDGVKVGSVLLSDIFDNVVILRTKEDNATCNLVSKPYYNATLIETDSSPVAPFDNNYYKLSDKTDSSGFSIGIDKGYYYTFENGSASVGEYSHKSSQKDTPYTGHLAENFTLPSGKATRPFNATAVKFTGMSDVSKPFASKGFLLEAGKVTSGTKDSTYLKSGKYVNAGVANGATVDDKYYAQVNFDGISWKENGALMFYVNHKKVSAKTEATKLYIINQTKWSCLTYGMPYYTLKDGETVWNSCTTAQNSGSAGDIELPANFSGWIRIPTADFKLYNGTGKTVEEHMLEGLQFFPYALGKEYGSIEISNIMTVDDGKNNHFSVKLSEKREEKLGEAGENTFKVKIGEFNGSKTFFTDASVMDLGSKIPFKAEQTLSKDKAFMMFVTNKGRASTHLALSFGKNHVRLGVKSKYYLYDVSDKVWASAYPDESGRIEIPAGFSGYVRAPYECLIDASNDALSGDLKFDSLYVLPSELGGVNAQLSVGSFLIVNHSLSDLPTMRVDLKDEIPLTGDYYYSALIPELSEVLGCGDVARTVTVSTQNCDFFDGGSIYTVSPKNADTVKMGADDGAEVAFKEDLTLENKNGLLIYFSLPDSANAVKLSTPFSLDKDSYVYVLSAGNHSEWVKQKVSADGSVSLPAGFDGYIRFPFASMKSDLSDDIKKFAVSFTAVGGSYGNPKFGNVMFINEAEYDLYDVLVSGTSTPRTLLRSTYLEGMLSKGGFSVLNDSKDSNHILAVDSVGNPLTANIEGGYASKISAPAQEVHITTETLPCIHFTPEKEYTEKINTSGGVMFYVKNDSQKENSLFFQAYGDVYATTLRASNYDTLQKGNAYWTKHASNGNGDITLPAGFEGWIKIPYSSLKSPNGTPLGEPINYFNFIFKNVGGEYGFLFVGDIIFLENNGDFGKLALEGIADKIDIYGSNGKTDYGRNDVAIWNSVTDPLIGYEEGKDVPFTVTTDSESSEQTSSKFSSVISNNTTPFLAKSVEFDSSNKLVNKNDTPRYSGVMPFAMNGSKGIVVAVDLPAAESGTNNLFFQISTASGKWLTVKYEFLLPVIRYGETDWSYVEVVNQRVALSNITETVDSKEITKGFKGYVYFPNEYLSTYNDATGVHTTLQSDDTVVNVACGFGEFGGDDGKAYINGIFTSQNGVLSHDGAFVDGVAECRNIFSGDTVSAEKVKTTIYDAPSKSGSMLLDLPEPTGGTETAYVENVTSRSADVIIDKFNSADRYRCDLYIMRSLPGQFGYTYYEYVSSTWSDSLNVKLDGLTTGIYYTLVVSAFNGDNGLCIYPLCSIFPESQVVGEMLVAQSDPYEYDWNTEDGSDFGKYEEYYEEYYDEIIEDDEDDGSDDIVPTVRRRRKIIRRRRKSNFPDWLWILIVVGGVILLGGATAVVVILKKKRRKQNV